ncbi:MAG: hypothetical protein JWO88_3157 [Frankiales bacterium]|nr:hypothetical protein [Frankiales bacterium]
MTDLSSLGAATTGVWTREDALLLLSERQIQTQLDNGIWQVVHRGVYADAGYVLSPEQRAFAAVLATGGADQPVEYGPPLADGSRRRRLRAVASGRTAARVWQFPLIDDDDPATGAADHTIDDVAVWYHGRHRKGPSSDLRRHHLRLGGKDIVRLPSGLYVMSPLRTALDCTRLLPFEAAVCVLDNALHRALVRTQQLHLAVQARVGEPGVAALRGAVAAADGRAEAPSETLARLLLKPVVPGLEPQVELFDRGLRLIARFDLGDEELRLAVETDGRRAHSGDAMVAKDRRRDRRTSARGWWTERATWWDLRRGQQQLLTRVAGEAERLRAAPLRRAG